MAPKKRRRAPSADWLAMTPTDREAVRQARFNSQSRRYHSDIRAITNGDAAPANKASETSK